ncbi:cytochrome P450 [Mycolicibacterium moriokaense]|nr:cytochrome P450 [Mycolicibacterium moriokaense]
MVELFDDLQDFGAFDDAVSGDIRDPYAALADARKSVPIQRIDATGMPGHQGVTMFMVYRHEDIVTILRDNETFSSAAVLNLFGDVLGHQVMLGLDEPAHGRLRALIAKAFTQKALAHWEDDLISAVGKELIDQIAPNGSADLVKEFTFPYPTQIIAGLLGLPRKDFPQFQRWSISLLSFVINPDRGRAASQALVDYFAPILAARREQPRDDIISRLAQAQTDGQTLTDEEIYSFLRLLLPAGVETTYRSLGNLLSALLSNTEQFDALRADRSLIPQAIEEAVRWDAPLLTITRTATRNTSLGGIEIPEGSSVMPMLGAANRQEDRYSNPDQFDIFRAARTPISWGHGVHVCLGMHLARLEMTVALNLLMDRLPNLRLDPSGHDPHIRGGAFRSPTCLPVLFDS